MRLPRDGFDAFQHPLWNIPAIEARNTVARIGSIQPGKGEPAAAAYAQGEQASAGRNPIQGNRTVRLGAKFGKRHAIGQGTQEPLDPQYGHRIDWSSGLTIPARCRTLGRQACQL